MSHSDPLEFQTQQRDRRGETPSSGGHESNMRSSRAWCAWRIHSTTHSRPAPNFNRPKEKQAMSSPNVRYERDLRRYRSDARKRLWLDDDCFDLYFRAHVAADQIENMLQRNPTSVTEMRQMLNELSSVFARVTHAMTRTTKPDGVVLRPDRSAPETTSRVHPV